MATIVSPFTSSQSVTAASGASPSWWLKDPLNPAVNIAINPQNQHDSDRAEHSTAFYPLGRTRPVVVADAMTGADGKLELLTFTAVDYTALLVMVNLQRVLLLQSPYGEQWYVRMMGKRSSKLFAGAAANPYRLTIVDYLEVDVP